MGKIIYEGIDNLSFSPGRVKNLSMRWAGNRTG
jgi:hypothetical protein